MVWKSGSLVDKKSLVEEEEEETTGLPGDEAGNKGVTENQHPMEGPNQIVPANVYTTSNVSTPVKIRYGEKDMVGRWTPASLPGVLSAAASMSPMKCALAYKKKAEDKVYEYITFREYLNLTRTVAKAFLKLGLQRLNSVAIIGFNSPEWFLSYLGSIFAGGVACGVYATNSAEATFYCLEKGLANLAVVEDEEKVQKIMQYKENLPNLKAIIQYTGKPTIKGVLSWQELMEIGKKEEDHSLQEALKKIAINECCTLLYTSGTTGPPKGVMLTHDNLIWNARSTLSSLELAEEERIISYLPLSQVTALLMDIYCHLLGKVTVYFTSRDALKGGLIKIALEVRPTRFLGVPRIWEKISLRMKAQGAEAGPIKQCFVNWAKTQGLHRNMDLMKGSDSPTVGYILAKALVFSKLKTKLGFDQCKTFWSGAAPLATEIKLYFASFDILILDAFGMTETSGVHSVNIPTAFRFESTGKTIAGAQTRIENTDGDKQGEVCIIGRHVFMGYVNDEEQTQQAIDVDGWLHSGDIGKTDMNGFLYITGRIKELLITMGGENISPVLIEENIKTELPFLGHAVVICEKKRFVSLLITLSSEVDYDTGQPLDELTENVKQWLRGLGFYFNTTTEVLASGPHEKILSAIQKGIDAANLKASSRAQRIQKFAILPKDFSISSGELGPTLKLKRAVINEKYREVIDKLYKNSGT